MFFPDSREQVLHSLVLIGGSLCDYTVEIDRWLNGRCDCKYSRQEAVKLRGEANGCPELRSIHAVVSALTDEEWNVLRRRAGGITTGEVIEAFSEQ